MGKARTLANLVSGASTSTLPNSALTNSSITINSSAVSLGGSTTVGETKPTVTGISPSVITNDATNITITGTNFVTVPTVEAISSTGAITRANTVSFTNATTIVANFTLTTDGTYFIRVENNDGNAVRSGSAILTVSDAPAWTTASGSLGSFAAGASFGTINLTATDSTSMSKTSGTFPGGMTLNSGGSGTSTLTGTESGATAETTYNFTIRATDAQGQTADRAFSITITVGINNSGQFN